MNIRSFLASSLGNTVEWYDFALFIYLGPVFEQVFFPTHDPAIATISLFATFAIGFICRPIGGIIFGHLGDRIGRSRTLLLSILLITIPTLLVCILPTYSQVGIWSPISLVVVRIIQGICIGGEYSGIIIYLAESAPYNHRALLTSSAATGANMGFLLGLGIATTVEYWLSTEQLHQFGWRVAFLVGALFGMFILHLRKYISETPEFKQLKMKHLIVKVPLIPAITENYLFIVKIIGLVAFGSVLYYTTFTYLIAYLQQVSQLTYQQITTLQTIFVTSMLFLVPLFGILCDKIGRKKMYLLLCGFGLLLSWFVFNLFHSQSYMLILIGLAILTIISSMEQATTLVSVVEMVPLKVRYTTLALAYNIANMLFGGLTPLLLIALIDYTHNTFAPAYYLMAMALLTLLAASVSLKINYLQKETY